MELTEALLILLYFLGSTLLVVLIVLSIKLITTMNKVNILVDDINGKIKSLDGLFTLVDMTTDKLAFLSDRLVDAITYIIKKMFKAKNGKEEEINE